ncbi:hypothetical protein ACIPJN_30075 [Streptomyces sp. NPDC086796]|uniref:hypothetical protein n=1 Tax=Streptomyces sp. NPDC086796 TaxID=3365760 RepID=UPI003822FEDF
MVQPVITADIAANVLWQEGKGGYPADDFVRQLLSAWWAADQVNAARLATGFPGHAAAIELLRQPGGADRLRSLAVGS